MSRALLLSFGVALIAVGSLEALQPPHDRLRDASRALPMPAVRVSAERTVAERTTAADRAVLDRYCVTCHNERLKTAGLALDTLDEIPAGASAWEKVVKKLRSGAMPPPGALRPDKATAASLAASLEDALDRAAAAAPNPGRIPIHRLNRAEYVNAVRDLLSLDIDGRSLLPADESG
jgi:cytochrome c5